MSRKAIIALTVLLVSLATLVAACGGSPHRAAEQNTVSPEPSPSPSPSPTENKVGDKVTVTSGDMKYDVTLLSVAEPAEPASEFSTPSAGHHFVAAEFRVTAVTAVDENANSDATVIGSDDQTYTSMFAELAAGTNFDSGSVRMQPGASLVGWVAFEVRNGVRAAKVRWTPASGFSGKAVEWTVNTTASPSPGAASPTAASPTAASPTAASPTAAAPTATPTAAAPYGDPRDTVIAYFDAINSHNFRQAWDLGGKNTTSSYASFVDGFKTTAWAGVEILDLSGDISTAVVQARLTTLETDGSSKVFEGEYTVRNGVITHFSVRQVS